MSNVQILVGADPELFVKDRVTGAFISGHGMVPGTKADPFPVECGFVQVDGTALEFNIDPSATPDAFVANIDKVMTQLQGMIPDNFEIVTEAVANYDPEYFSTVPEDAKALGCDPDFNAWGMVQNTPPEVNQPMRTASGHVHIGWGDFSDSWTTVDHYYTCGALARQLDYYLGINSLLWDKDATRRQMYGKAGCFRVKPYGMEYRVLSNAWLKDKNLMRWVHSAAIQGVEDMMQGKRAEEVHGDLAQQVIDENIVAWKDIYPDLSPVEFPYVTEAKEEKVA